jgi:hypothetical protein
MENKLNPSDTGLLASVNECITIAKKTLEQCEYQKRYLRSPQSKRANQRSIEFWSAIAWHLEKLKKHNEEWKQQSISPTTTPPSTDC